MRTMLLTQEKLNELKKKSLVVIKWYFDPDVMALLRSLPGWTNCGTSSPPRVKRPRVSII
jgi:hypothetical protein